MKTKKNKVILICEECLSRNYSFPKSTLTQKERLEIKKYCPTCQKHQLHKETR